MSRLSSKTEQLICQFLTKVSEYEYNSEILKHTLIKLPSFDPYSLVIKLDIDNTGNITNHDLKEFLSLHKIQVSEIHIDQILFNSSKNYIE